MTGETSCLLNNYSQLFQQFKTTKQFEFHLSVKKQLETIYKIDPEFIYNFMNSCPNFGIFTYNYENIIDEYYQKDFLKYVHKLIDYFKQVNFSFNTLLTK